MWQSRKILLVIGALALSVALVLVFRRDLWRGRAQIVGVLQPAGDPSLFAQRDAPRLTLKGQIFSAEEAEAAARDAAESRWRSFARPLAIGREQTILFQRAKLGAIGWLYDWTSNQVTKFDLPGLALRDKEDYTPVATEQGLWLVGATAYLLKADGTHLTQQIPVSSAPAAVGLADGSIVVFTNSTSERYSNTAGRILHLTAVEQTNSIKIDDQGVVAYNGEIGPPTKDRSYDPSYGLAVAGLADGRILMLGGWNTPTSVATFDLQSSKVQPLKDIPHERVYAATTLLPDGRVVVAGGQAHSGPCGGAAAYQVDVLDISTREGKWSSLPALPFPLCSSAYWATAPSLTVADDGALIAGGHLESNVMVLPADKSNPTGFARSWLVIATPQQRISGVVQAITKDEIVVSGGVHTDSGCCFSTASVDRVARRSSDEKFKSLSLELLGPMAAQNKNRVFIASGRKFSTTGTGQMRYSSLVELLDLQTGSIKQLDSLPFISGGGDATWLDDDQVLVKGAPTITENLSSYMPESAGNLGVYTVSTGAWREISLENNTDLNFIGVSNGKALLRSSAGGLLVVPTRGGKAKSLLPDVFHRQGGVSRWLADGRLITAGGYEPEQLISVADPDCESATSDPSSCEEHFAGYGSPVPSRYSETYVNTNFDAAESKGQWTLSSPSRTGGISAVIYADGSVAKIGRITTNKNTESDSLYDRDIPIAFERSDPKGSKWTQMPLGELERACNQDLPDCRLLLATDPRDPSKELLFLCVGNINQEGIEAASASMRLWWFDNESNQWRLMLSASGVDARSTPLELPAPFSNSDIRLRSLGWHLKSPILWLEKNNDPKPIS